FGAAFVRLKTSVTQMTVQASQLRYNMASVDAVIDDLEELKAYGPTIKTETNVGPLPLTSSIALRNVTYTYPGAPAPALQDISLTIRRGDSVGFVGATGSGKTTLINVLLGLLRPQEGLITVDDQDIFDNLRGWQN